jgi:hypothetical protein
VTTRRALAQWEGTPHIGTPGRPWDGKPATVAARSGAGHGMR